MINIGAFFAITDLTTVEPWINLSFRPLSRLISVQSEKVLPPMRGYGIWRLFGKLLQEFTHIERGSYEVIIIFTPSSVAIRRDAFH